MEAYIISLMGWIGIYSPVALAAIGSSVGCTIAGKAACGAILEVDGGYGRYIGLSVLPSSIVIYGIVIMFALNRPVSPATSPGQRARCYGSRIAVPICKYSRRLRGSA